MKKDAHPKYELAIIRCACGSEVETRTTRPGFNVEICASCHPFFTGKQKLIDTAGRVDRFRKRYGLEGEAATADALARAGQRAGKEVAGKKTKKSATGSAAQMKKAKKMAARAQAEAAESAKEFSRAPKAPPKTEPPAAEGEGVVET